MKTLYDVIAQQPFSRGMSQEQLRWLADNAMQTWFEAGELIYRDGDLANRFYLLVDGNVALELSAGRRTVPLQIIGPGEPLAWSWLFSSHVSLVRARAVEPVEAVYFYGTRLRDCCEKEHEFGYELFRRVAEAMMQRLQTTRRLLLERSRPKVMASYDWQPGQH